MSTSLSKIRRSLQEPNSIRKYIVYAIGEILLVMIGILLALQVNNWNEERKNRKFEKNILNEISRNLQIDANNLSEIVDSRTQSVQAIDRILTLKRQNGKLEELPYLLGDIINHDRYFVIINAYEVLKSKGLDIIQNDSLKLDLGRYYDNYANEIQLQNKDIEDAFYKWTEMLGAEIEDFEWKEKVVLRNPEKIISDPSLMSFLKLQKSNHVGTGSRNQRMLDLNLKLQKMIDSEFQN